MTRPCQFSMTTCDTSDDVWQDLVSSVWQPVILSDDVWQDLVSSVWQPVIFSDDVWQDLVSLVWQPVILSDDVWQDLQNWRYFCYQYSIVSCIWRYNDQLFSVSRVHWYRQYQRINVQITDNYITLKI